MSKVLAPSAPDILIQTYYTDFQRSYSYLNEHIVSWFAYKSSNHQIQLKWEVAETKRDNLYLVHAQMSPKHAWAILFASDCVRARTIYRSHNIAQYKRPEMIVRQKCVRLTTQADCTASDTLPALGSHQNTWHWKCWFPVSMMKANVCTSRPTPINDRKRTRHSTSTSSSSSCTHTHTCTHRNELLRSFCLDIFRPFLAFFLNFSLMAKARKQQEIQRTFFFRAPTSLS